MKKKEYIKPHFTVLKSTIQRLLAGSQFNIPAYDPDDEVNAEEAL